MSTQVVQVVQGPTKVVGIPRAVGPRGPQGDPGPTGPPGADGENGQPGADGTPGPAGEDGAPGSDGREIALRTAAGFVQWQYDGDPGWTNLIALADLTGPRGDDGTDGTNGADGKSVELRVSGGYIQWRQTDGAWANLIALTAITGPAGEDGAPGSPGADGADGEDGAPGVGVPAGGTTGQVLTKTGAGDYATGWTDPAGGSGGSDAATAGWVTDEDSLTRTALDAAFVGSDTIRRIRTTDDPNDVAGDDELLVVLPAPRVVAAAHSEQTYGDADALTSVTATIPTDVNAGDMLVAMVASRSDVTSGGPSGWTRESTSTGPGTTGSTTVMLRASMWTKHAAGTEGGSTVTFTQATAGRLSAVVFVVRSGSGTVTVETTATASYAVSSQAAGAHPIPAAAPNGRGRLALHFGQCAWVNTVGPSTISIPAEWTVVTPQSVPQTPTYNALRAWAAYRHLSDGDSTAGVCTHQSSLVHDGGSITAILAAG